MLHVLAWVAYRDQGTQAVLEEVLELAEGIIGALTSDALPEAPAGVHVHCDGHDYQQRVAKLVVAHKNEGTLHIHPVWLQQASPRAYTVHGRRQPASR